MTPSRDIGKLIEIMAALRTPGTGCPWDLEQDFASIAPYTIEEAYEVADAIEQGDLAALKDELGDLLLQVVYHARMAEETGAFALASHLMAGASGDNAGYEAAAFDVVGLLGGRLVGNGVRNYATDGRWRDPAEKAAEGLAGAAWSWGLDRAHDILGAFGSCPPSTVPHPTPEPHP